MLAQLVVLAQGQTVDLRNDVNVFVGEGGFECRSPPRFLDRNIFEAAKASAVLTETTTTVVFVDLDARKGAVVVVSRHPHRLRPQEAVRNDVLILSVVKGPSVVAVGAVPLGAFPNLHDEIRELGALEVGHDKVGEAGGRLIAPHEFHVRQPRRAGARSVRAHQAVGVHVIDVTGLQLDLVAEQRVRSVVVVAVAVAVVAFGENPLMFLAVAPFELVLAVLVRRVVRTVVIVRIEIRALAGQVLAAVLAPVERIIDGHDVRDVNGVCLVFVFVVLGRFANSVIHPLGSGAAERDRPASQPKGESASEEHGVGGNVCLDNIDLYISLESVYGGVYAYDGKCAVLCCAVFFMAGLDVVHLCSSKEDRERESSAIESCVENIGGERERARDI
mmetsp:Transcript_28746/g.84783  ORF Transcript_28746/g.84783 Transcript_28746/m.84783 type:complete len:389 (-) Transcript_28746:139-1305(-)